MTKFFNRITALGILAIGCSTLATATPTLESILYQEDFEGLNIGTVIDAQGWTTSWGTWDTGENADVVSGTDSPFTPTGTQYLHINDTVDEDGTGSENSVSPPDTALPTDKRLYFAYDINPINGGRWQIRSGTPLWFRWSGNDSRISTQVNLSNSVDLSSADAWARVELTARMTLAELDAAGGVNMSWDYTVTDSDGTVSNFADVSAPVSFGTYSLGDAVPEFLFGAINASEYYIDNLVIGTVIPEPASAALLLLGAALLSRLRRK